MDVPFYIKVILPLKLAWEPWYRTSEEVRTGMRVSVSFAGRRYIGVVSCTAAAPDVDPSRVLPVLAIEHHLDLIGEKELQLWHFIADYYLCTIGEVYKLAYPASKTAGEAVRARAEERREALTARTEALYRKRIAALEERLAKKEAALSGKHNPKVTAALEAGRDKILAELEEARKKLNAINKADYIKPAEARDKTGDKGGTVLVQGGVARFSYLMEAARAAMDAGRNVLMLVPEIALSRSLQSMLREAFGDAVLVFHSAESAGNRREVATRLRRGGEPCLVLGTRSALFLPFRDLGLIIVEEEHDSAYKQDSMPRYGARDTAVMLGSIHGARVILSSPTPSLESIYNCMSGRYELVRLPLEEGALEIVDTAVEARKRGMVGDLSRVLISHIRETLEKHGNVLIIRPWGPLDDIKGQVEGLFPDAGGSIRYATVHEARRMDMAGISLLALLGADVLMDKHDFRADEKAMQTLEQLRSRLTGHMVVQTRQGEHPVYLQDSDYALRLLEERKAFHLPPYSRLVDVVVRDGNAARLAKLAGLLAEALRGFAPAGPFPLFRGREPEPDARIIRITLPRDRQLPASKRKIAGIIGDFEKSYKYTGHIQPDVDPV